MSFHKFRDKKGNSYPHLYIDEGSGIFYAVARKGKKVLKASLETADFNTARSKLFEALRAFEVSKNIPKTNKLLREYWDDLLKEKIAKETKDSTMVRMNTVWDKSIKPYWGHLNPSDITQDEVTEFIIWHREKRPGIQFINVFKYLGNLFRFLKHRGLIQFVPELEIPKTEARHHAKKKGRVVTDDEFKSIYEHLDERTQLISRIAICTGMRQMEIGSIRKDQISLHDGVFIFSLDTDDTKTGLAREIPMPKFLNDQLRAFYGKAKDYLFPKKSGPGHIPGQLIDHSWQRAKEKAGIIGRLRFHDLRHTAATKMAQQGINPIIACTMLGMTFSTYQKTYLNLTVKDLIMASESLFASLGETHAKP